MFEAIVASLVGAALWHFIVLGLSRYKEARIRASLQAHASLCVQSTASDNDPCDSVEVQQGPIRMSLGSYGGIHRSPYLYIRNSGEKPFIVLAVVFNIAKYGDFSAPYETADGEGVGTLSLAPSEWGKWIYCCGRNIPEQYDELISCTILIKYTAIWGIRKIMKLPIDGELFEMLKKQLKENKRGSPWPTT